MGFSNELYSDQRYFLVLFTKFTVKLRYIEIEMQYNRQLLGNNLLKSWLAKNSSFSNIIQSYFFVQAVFNSAGFFQNNVGSHKNCFSIFSGKLRYLIYVKKKSQNNPFSNVCSSSDMRKKFIWPLTNNSSS